MGIKIRYADSVFVEVQERITIAGTTAFGTHKLVCEFDLNTAASAGRSPVAMLTLFGRVDVQNRELGWLAPDYRAALSTAATARTVQLRLAMNLGTAQLEALTRSFPEGLISFRIGFVGIASGPSGTCEVSGLGHCTFDRDQWIKALDQCGFADAFNVWLQIPRSACESLRDATDALKQAQSHHLAGRFEDAIGRCRVAIEKVNSSARRFDFKNHEVRSLLDRITLVQAALFKLTSEPHHETAKDYGANESRLTLALAAAMIEYAAPKS